VAALFLVFGVASIFAAAKVDVNYDMSDYLPEQAESTIAISAMEDAYDAKVPNLRVMMRGVSVQEAMEYKARLEAVPRVGSVSWLDDAVDILEPIEIQDSKTVESWYKDGNALFQLVVSEETEQQTLADIREIVGENGAVSGGPLDTVDTRNNISSELGRVMLIVIPVAVALLMLATTSWIDPFLMLFKHSGSDSAQHGHQYFYRGGVLHNQHHGYGASACLLDRLFNIFAGQLCGAA
jgi:predicted RND superfamily exporter protein